MKTTLKYGLATTAAALSIGQASAEPLVGLTAGKTLVAFDSTAPGVVTSTRVITGTGTDVLVGIDKRPSNNKLYAIASNGNLYRIDLGGVGGTAVAVLIGDTGANLSGNRFGVDFNPTVDRLRVVSDFDQNLRINPNDATRITDTAITNPSGDQRALVGVAYTNNVAGATTTQLYALDATGNQLQLSVAPNAGTYNAVGVVTGNLGGNNVVGFDISGLTGAAFFNNASELFSLNLSNAQATSLGTIGAGSLVGLTAAGVPEPATWALMIGGFGMVGGAMRVRSRKARVAVA